MAIQQMLLSYLSKTYVEPWNHVIRMDKTLAACFFICLSQTISLVVTYFISAVKNSLLQTRHIKESSNNLLCSWIKHNYSYCQKKCLFLT